MKKLFCTSLIAMILLSGTISNVKAETITNFQGKKAEVFTSVDGHQSFTGVKTTASVSFIEDENNNDLIALITIKGFIPSGIERVGDKWNARMYWPRKYNITLESQGNDNVKIIESIPSNKIESVNVTDTIGYNIGGNIGADKKSPTGGFTAKADVKHSISYEQPDFKTVQKVDGIRKTSWDIDFNSTKDGYDRNSYHFLYGNQLFMKSRLYNDAINNLTDDKDLSPLISGGFSPNVVIALKAPKNTEKSKLVLTYNVYKDVYSLYWSTSQWTGSNSSIKTPEETKHIYEIDWQKHTIKIQK